MNFKFFPISWHSTENAIRIYGIKENCQRPVCIKISQFDFTIAIELDEKYSWSESIVDELMLSLKKIMRNVSPSSIEYAKKRLLYGAHVNADGSPKLFNFLIVKFSNSNAAKFCENLLRCGVYVSSFGKKINLRAHYTSNKLWFQFVLNNQLPVCNWIQIDNAMKSMNKITICDDEYDVEVCEVKPIDNPPLPPHVPVLSYDIETYSSTAAMCNPNVAEDKIFQISMVMDDEMILITRGIVDVEKIKSKYPNFNVNVWHVYSETELIETYVDQLRILQPLIITGYNNMGFDGTYIIKRAQQYANCFAALEKLSFCLIEPAIEREVAWSSAARPEQRFNYMQGEGIVIIDLMTIIRQDFASKFSDYKLETMAIHFLNDKKDDMTPTKLNSIFKRVMIDKNNKQAIDDLTLVGSYCIKDSLLVLQLMKKLDTMQKLYAMANVCNCSIGDLCIRGQQHKVMSLITKFCHDDGIIVDKVNKMTSNESYRGATVFDPILGLHQNIVSFDFTSLYPSVMIANNLCASTLIDENDESIPNEKCKIMEWEDHVKCAHDEKWIEKQNGSKNVAKCKEIALKNRDIFSWKLYVDALLNNAHVSKYNPSEFFCTKRKFKWYQGYLGIYPRILDMLMKKRVECRKILKEKTKLRKECIDGDEAKQLEMEMVVLDSKQLALKLTCNSLYGFTGSKTSPIPCVAIAMCTTYSGRQVIQQASEVIQSKFNGIRVYGDSVSADTPIIVKDAKNIIYIKSIDDIAIEWHEYPGFKCDGEIRNDKEQSSTDYLVWSYDHWTPIKRVIRHHVAKQMYRIVTHTGCVDVTEDHSLLYQDGTKVKPNVLKHGELLMHGFPVLNSFDNSISLDECWIMGLFFADGSAYADKSKFMWNISKQDTNLLGKALAKLIGLYPDEKFKIHNYMASSKVFKLCSSGNFLARKYRQLFYDKDKLKIVPTAILNGTIESKRAFCAGYYAGDGTKNISYLNFSVKGKIGAQGLFALFKSIGYNLTVNCRVDKPNIFRIQSSTTYRINPEAIKKIIPLGMTTEYVYDLEADGKFNAGIGCLTVANTDSNYVKFNGYDDYSSLYNFAKQVASYVSAQFPACINIEFEDEIYAKWLIMNKKQYCFATLNADNTINTKLKAKGLLLVRRENCKWVRMVYEHVVWLIFNHSTVNEIVDYVLNQCFLLVQRCVDVELLSISKTVGSWESKSENENGKAKIGKYIVPKLPAGEEERQLLFYKENVDNEDLYYQSKLPAHVQLAIRLNERGVLVIPGERLHYIVTNVSKHKEKLNHKLESVQWFKQNAQYLTIDFLHYIDAITSAVDTLLDSQYERKFNILETFCLRCKHLKPCIDCKKLVNYMMFQLSNGRCEVIYKQFVLKNKLNNELLNLFRPKFVV
jgi:DNA polymerase elongation subunit (family B)